MNLQRRQPQTAPVPRIRVPASHRNNSSAASPESGPHKGEESITTLDGWEDGSANWLKTPRRADFPRNMYTEKSFAVVLCHRGPASVSTLWQGICIAEQGHQVGRRPAVVPKPPWSMIRSAIRCFDSSTLDFPLWRQYQEKKQTRSRI